MSEQHVDRPHGGGHAHGVVAAGGPDPYQGAALAVNSFAGGAVARVITCSDRAAAGEYRDEAGPIAVERLTAWGFTVPAAAVVPDGPAVGAALRQACADGARVVLTVGGTGVASRDLTPENTASLLTRKLDGVAQAIREVGVARGVPTSIISRGLAGLACGTSGQVIVVNLPGSKGAVKDGLDVLATVVPHLLSQLE